VPIISKLAENKKGKLVKAGQSCLQATSAQAHDAEVENYHNGGQG
jgi:hypothetical protein